VPTIDLSGASIHYEVRGRSNGPGLLFCNALGTSAELWWRQVAAFEPEFKVVTFDLPGHGRSTGQSSIPPSIEQLGLAALGVLDAAGLPSASVCGLSIGGMTGIWLAAHHPHRVERLVLASTAPELGPAERWVERAADVRAEGMQTVLDRALGRWFTPGYLDTDPEAAAVLHRMVESCSAEGYAAACLALAAADLRPVLPLVTAPTIVVSGQDDPAIAQETTRSLGEAVGGLPPVVIEGASHLLNMEQATAFNELLRKHLG
jgi:3-oxoadipate enol-lactonase